ATLFNSAAVAGQLPVNFVQMPGSSINISGGYLTYTPGFVRVSMLVNAYGQLVSASTECPVRRRLLLIRGRSQCRVQARRGAHPNLHQRADSFRLLQPELRPGRGGG